ncbi:MAG: NUDIX domain-containing protein [Ardenticatenaceae bacterium]|nr:NUDIX domain-containing protein [Ardenticatenaceae bacterium]
MRMGSAGILVNELGQVLLIRRNDTRTFAPPGGGLETGELPPDNAAREVREETGIIAMPVRLVGLYYWRPRNVGFLNFYFRCIQRGGELQPSAESPQVGFFTTTPLPQPMLRVHRLRIQEALTHAGGRPFWSQQPIPFATKLSYTFMRRLVYPYLDWQRRRKGVPPYIPPPTWQTAVSLIITNPDGHILWQRNGDTWQLPGGDAIADVPPWQTAVHHSQTQLQQAITLTHLTGVYPSPDKPHMTFTFAAELANGRLPTTANLAYFPPSAEPQTSHPTHKAQAADALSSQEETIFRFQ